MKASIEELLDQVHLCLLAGDLQAISTLEASIVAAMDDLPHLDPAGTLRLRTKAERNARLLQAAIRGLRAALYRRVDIARGATLFTYDSKGRSAAIPGPEMALGRL